MGILGKRSLSRPRCCLGWTNLYSVGSFPTVCTISLILNEIIVHLVPIVKNVQYMQKTFTCQFTTQQRNSVYSLAKKKLGLLAQG